MLLVPIWQFLFCCSEIPCSEIPFTQSDLDIQWGVDVVSEAPLRCPLSMVSVLVKDKKETKKLQQAARTRKFRFRRQASMKKVAPKKRANMQLIGLPTG